MHLLYILRGFLIKEKYKLKIIQMKNLNGGCKNCIKPLIIHFISVPGHGHSIQTGPGTSLFSYSCLSLPSRHHSLFLLTIPKQDQESLSAPYPDCLCKAGAIFWPCSINLNRTGNLSLLLLWTFSPQKAPLPVQVSSVFQDY